MNEIKDTWQHKLSKPSVIFIIAVTCFIVVTMDFWRTWHKGDSNFSWDVANYYSYLPAYFCNDGSFEFNTFGFVNDYLPKHPVTNLHMPKTTCGMAILYAPFFALGYKIAYNQQDPLDGFSEAFATTLHWGMLVYAILGLLLLRNFLVNFFSEKVTTITLFIVFLGTSLLYYSLTQPEAPHSSLFFLFSAFLLVNYNWHQKQTIARSVILGILIGFISLIRPTDLVIILLFIFWPLNNSFSVKQKINFFMERYKLVIVMIVSAFLVWLPQFFFWKARTGQFLYFSYGDERFFWTDPQFINVLFSYRKGLLVYTPLIGLALIGFFLKYKQLTLVNRITLIVFLINLYVVSCWWDWFFGGSFCARPFVQHFAYLSIPLAILIARIFESDTQSMVKGILYVSMIIIISIGVSLNIFQTYQYNAGIIHHNAMTKKTYWLVFGKSKLNAREQDEFWGSLKEPDYTKLRSGENRDQ